MIVPSPMVRIPILRLEDLSALLAPPPPASFVQLRLPLRLPLRNPSSVYTPSVHRLLEAADVLAGASDGAVVAELVDVDRRTARRLVEAVVAGELAWRGFRYTVTRAELRLERVGRHLVVRRSGGPP